MLARPSGDAPSTRSSRPRANTSATPDAAHDERHAEPEGDDEDEARRPADPAAIEPSRISRALVDGISPPARPRTNRLRQVMVEPAGGRWRVADAAVLVVARLVLGFDRVGVVVRVVVRVVVCLGVVVVVRRAAWSWACPAAAARCRGRRAPAPDLAEQHPAADHDDRDRGHDRRRPHDHDVGRPGRPGRRRRRPRARGSRWCATASPRVRDPTAWSGGPARPDEVGGHQGLAVAGRERVAGAEADRGQQREQQHDRGEVGGAEDRRQLARRSRRPAPTPSGRRGRPTRPARPAPPWRPVRPVPRPAAVTGVASSNATGASSAPPGDAVSAIDRSSSGAARRSFG